MEGQFVSEAIVSKFKDFDDREISIQIKKMVLFLAESSNFEQLFPEEGN